MPYPGAVPPKKSNTWKIVAIIGGLVALLCCAGAVGLAVWGFTSIRDATGPVRDTASSFLDNLRDEQYGDAYDQLCRDARRQVSRQNFAQAMAGLPRITDHTVVGVNVNNTNGRVTGEVRVELTRELLGRTTNTMRLSKEDDEWKVCQIGF